MTRKIAQPAKYVALVALLIMMAMQIDPALAENTAQVELDTFGELLDGVTDEVLATPIQHENTIVEKPIPYAELFVPQISYLKAFEEVIQNNIF